jgi:hypothetical protein
MRGRPLKFRTAKALQKKIDEYFDSCDNRTTKVLTKTGAIVDMPDPKPYTITGLALALDTSRQTLLNYEEREEFFDTIRKAKLRIENYVEESLWTPKITSGVIFNLKNNFAWVDKQSVEHSGETTQNVNTNMDLSHLTDEELEQIEYLLSKRPNT